MADLPEFSTYRGLASAIKPMARASYNITKNLPAKRRSRPVDVSGYQNVTNKLGPVTVPYGGSTKYEKFHPGVDVANKIGTPIPARAGGKVTEVVSGKIQGDPGFGNYVVVTDAKGNKHRYSHLNNSWVQLGSTITPGTVIGGMGNTGQTYSTSGGTGSHLDYRIKNMYGKYVNPSNFIYT